MNFTLFDYENICVYVWYDTGLDIDRKSVFFNEQMKEEQAEVFGLTPRGSSFILILKVTCALSLTTAKRQCTTRK